MGTDALGALMKASCPVVRGAASGRSFNGYASATMAVRRDGGLSRFDRAGAEL
jgi:hypothetical protein